MMSLIHADDGSFVVVRSSEEHQLQSISELHVADLISHVAGLPPVHQHTDRTHFPRSSLFSRPSANLLVSIDSVTLDILNEAPTHFFNFENDRTISLKKADYPEDAVSTATTILTGEDYTSHGIVGSSWKFSKSISVEGYSDNGNCQVAKINDRVAMNSEGGARIISLSSNRQMAAAMGIHTELAAAHPDWNAEAMYYAKKQGLVDLYSGETIKSIDEIRDFARYNGMTLKTAEGHKLASELYGIKLIPQHIQSMTRADNVHAPDMINIGISSIRQLSLRYGVGSPQVLDAIRLLDNALVELMGQLEEYYNGEITTEIINLQSSTEEHSFYTQAKQQVHLKDDAPTTTDDSDTYTQDEVSAFQTKFWVAIVLTIAIILGALALVKMDMLENSLIYRTTDGPRPIPDVQ